MGANWWIEEREAGVENWSEESKIGHFGAGERQMKIGVGEAVDLMRMWGGLNRDESEGVACQ